MSSGRPTTNAASMLIRAQDGAEDDDDGRAASMRYDEPDRPPPRRSRSGPKDDEPRLISDPQLKKIMTLMTKSGITDRQQRLDFCAEVIGHPLESSKALTLAEANTVIEALEVGYAEPHDENPGGGSA